MPDKEKVIKGLECCASMNGGACRECPYSSECVASEVLYQTGTAHLAADALALLKEQEAKPVIVTTNAYGTKFYHCPRCNRDLYIYPRQSYCSNCGQAVKWE